MGTIVRIREGETVPDGARFLRSEQVKIPGTEREVILPGTGILGFLGVTERYGYVWQWETVYIYELPHTLPGHRDVDASTLERRCGEAFAESLGWKPPKEG